VTFAILHQALFILFPLGLAYGALSDVTTMTIPNRLVLALLLGFLLLAPLAGMDLKSFGFHMAAGATVLAVSFAMFSFGWIGGGDAKFAATIALWLGWSHTFEFVLISAMFGGILTLVILSFRRMMLPAFALRQSWLFRLHDPNAGVPYGVALAAAGLVVYPKTVWIGVAIG
jgi:prepilin peptidase CpaA